MVKEYKLYDAPALLIESFIDNFKFSHCHGTDLTPSSYVKLCKKFISKPLICIFNSSLLSDSFPIHGNRLKLFYCSHQAIKKVFKITIILRNYLCVFLPGKSTFSFLLEFASQKSCKSLLFFRRRDY